MSEPSAPPPPRADPHGARAATSPPGWPPPAGTAVALPAPPVPLPPSPFVVALSAFWAARGAKAPRSTLVLAAAVGVMAAALLVGHPLGLGAALVGMLIWVPALPGLVRRRAVGDMATAALSVALLAVVAVSDAAWVVALCVGAAAVAGAVAATSARSAPAVVLSGVSWFAGALRAFPWLGRGMGDVMGPRRGQALIALRSVAVTAVLLVVFGVLFASADPVFASYLPQVDLDRLPGQLVVGTAVALTAATLAHLALAPPGWSALRLPTAPATRRGEWLLPVIALDVMVVGFVLVQIGGLLGGHRHVLETAGLTYAEYARTGFAQLVAVTALTLLVVALAARRAPRSSARDRWVSRAALGVLCLGTLGVVASALRRMDLYMEAFGLTRLRLFVVVVEVVLAVLLLLVMAAGVRWRGGWLPRAVVHVVAVAMLGLAVVNPDALIARHNTTPGLEIPLDLAYLRGLSADAVPALDGLDEPLRSCVLEWVVVDAPGGLTDWNLARDRAARALASGLPVEVVGSGCAAVQVDR